MWWLFASIVSITINFIDDLLCLCFTDAQKAAHLLGINVDELCKSLVRPRIKVGNEWVAQGRDSDQVTFSIAAISMALYERMFRWLVARVNKTLDYKVRALQHSLLPWHCCVSNE